MKNCFLTIYFFVLLWFLDWWQGIWHSPSGHTSHTGEYSQWGGAPVTLWLQFCIIPHHIQQSNSSLCFAIWFFCSWRMRRMHLCWRTPACWTQTIWMLTPVKHRLWPALTVETRCTSNGMHPHTHTHDRYHQQQQHQHKTSKFYPGLGLIISSTCYLFQPCFNIVAYECYMKSILPSKCITPALLLLFCLKNPQAMGQLKFIFINYNLIHL